MTESAPLTIYCTTREAAKILGISLRTAQLWVENGLLDAWKTEGGHRRITRASVQRLLNGREVAPDELPAAPNPLARLKVLVVEDDTVLLKLYKAVIASWKLPVDLITATNGVEGLIRIGRETPDLLITDLVMPGMDGFQLIRNLSASSFREGLEIVVVSGLESSQIEAHGGLPDDVRLFAKPAPFAVLREIVASMIERRAAYL